MKELQKEWQPNGVKYHNLLVLSFSHRDERGRAYYNTLCDCGKEKTLLGSAVKSGNTKSCGCLRRRLKAETRLPNNQAEVSAVILGYKRHADRRAYPWELDFDFVNDLIRQECYYCKLPPSNLKTLKNSLEAFKYSGIDRKDNTKGYTKDNVVPCCKICNNAKSDLTLEQFKEWILRIERATKAFADQWG